MRVIFISTVFACAALVSATLFAADAPKVKTDNGKVQGYVSTDGQVRIFKGIPYAAPPVGPLRWKPRLSTLLLVEEASAALEASSTSSKVERRQSCDELRLALHAAHAL